MADKNIIINVGEIEGDANKLKTHMDELDGCLKNIFNKVMALENTSWSSEASHEIHSNMKAMEAKIEKQREVIQAFVDFLRNQVKEFYEKQERIAITNASKFKQ